jgi:hypothetical protein
MVVMKSTIFWDITPCNPLKVERRFGGTYHLLQDLISRAGYKSESKWQAKSASRFGTYLKAGILLGFSALKMEVI